MRRDAWATQPKSVSKHGENKHALESAVFLGVNWRRGCFALCRERVLRRCSTKRVHGRPAKSGSLAGGSAGDRRQARDYRLDRPFAPPERVFACAFRSKDGAEGVSVTNGRAYLHPILQQLVIPYFLGKDARDLEEHLFQVYRHADNYKLQGLALWCPVAWVEFAILDMLGRITGKSFGELLGGIVRREVPFYVASGRRDSTPEQEVEYLLHLIAATGAKAVKFRVGGRMSRNADAMPGRTDRLIPLSRKRLGDKIDIHADANSSYDPPHAIEIGQMLEDIKAVYFEEPCPFDHLEDTKQWPMRSRSRWRRASRSSASGAFAGRSTTGASTSSSPICTITAG